MKKLIFGLAAGLLIGSAGTAIASQTGAVEAVFSKFNLRIDNKEIVQIEPLIYDGTSYLPVREVGELLGYEVDYEDENRMIILKTPGQDKKSSSEAGKKVNIADINMDEWASYSDLSSFYKKEGPSLTYLMSTPEGYTKLILDGEEILFHTSGVSNDPGPTLYKDASGKYSLLVLDKKEYFPIDIGRDFGLPVPNEWISQDDLEKLYPSVHFHQTWHHPLREVDYFTPVEVELNIGTVKAFRSIEYYFYKADIEKLMSDQ